jgi:P-type conjugative transfer protein TrbJ
MIDQAFTQQYPQAYSSGTFSQQLLSDAQSRWENARAGFQDTMRVQAGVVQNLDSTRTQIDAVVTASQGRYRSAPSRAVRQSARRHPDQAAR